jgi:hypothetical protein
MASNWSVLLRISVRLGVLRLDGVVSPVWVVTPDVFALDGALHRRCCGEHLLSDLDRQVQRRLRAIGFQQPVARKATLT